jgi:hypothetical protein
MLSQAQVSQIKVRLIRGHERDRHAFDVGLDNAHNKVYDTRTLVTCVCVNRPSTFNYVDGGE